MGSSSTKRKSSSASKKRLSRKSSSQLRKRKTDRSRSKKEKSRKVLRHEDSDSYSDSDSRSLSTSFSSEDSYSRKRSRSRIHKDGKGSSKRARRSPSSDSPRVKKRKVSKRKADLDSRKKSIKKKKKKSKRDLSPSSASQSSCSCSGCCGGASTCSESEYETTRGRRSERKYRYEEDVKKDRSGTRRNSRLRSQSSPADSRKTEDSGYYSMEKSIGEDYTKRLRSVITVVKAPEQDEESKLLKGQKTDYLVYDHDDYPSDRSNGSSECGNKMAFGHHSLITSAASTVKDVNDKDAFISSDRTFMVSTGDDEDRYDGRATWNGAETKNQVTENEGEVSADTVNPEAEDLESVLRQRALENLLKFRGGIPKRTGQNEKSDSGDAQQMSRAKPVSTRLISDKDDGNEVMSDTRVVAQTILPATSPARLQIGQDTDPKEHSSTRSASPGVVQTEDHKEAGSETIESKSTSLGNDCQVSGTDSTSVATVNAGSKSVRLASSGYPKQKADESSGVKSLTLPSKREPIGTLASVKQMLTSIASVNSKSLALKREFDESPAGTSPLTPQSGKKTDEDELSAAAGADSFAPHTSSSNHGFVEETSGDVQGETKDSSQYEQKTMSVMRGGEMVQVKYKVYIPKKAPALARRQLKR